MYFTVFKLAYVLSFQNRRTFNSGKTRRFLTLRGRPYTVPTKLVCVCFRFLSLSLKHFYIHDMWFCLYCFCYTLACPVFVAVLKWRFVKYEQDFDVFNVYNSEVAFIWKHHLTNCLNGKTCKLLTSLILRQEIFMEHRLWSISRHDKFAEVLDSLTCIWCLVNLHEKVECAKHWMREVKLITPVFRYSSCIQYDKF